MLTTAVPMSVPATPKYDATTAADSEASAPAMIAVRLTRFGCFGCSSGCVPVMSSFFRAPGPEGAGAPAVGPASQHGAPRQSQRRGYHHYQKLSPIASAEPIVSAMPTPESDV